MQQEKNAQLSLEQARHFEELFWHQKAKIQWHCEGDRNTTFFHRVAKIKNTSNLITSIKDGETMLTDSKDISEHIVNHFTSIFNNNNTTIDNGLVDEVIPSLITDRINNLLTLLPSDDEIYHIVFS